MIFDFQGMVFALTSHLFMWVFIIFFILFVWKTPAVTFLKASLRGRTMIANPMENGYWNFRAGKAWGKLVETGKKKTKGYFSIGKGKKMGANFWIEQKSKVPIAIGYGAHVSTVDIKVAKVAEKLKELGIENYEELAGVIEEAKQKNEKINIDVLGETVDLSNVADFLTENFKTSDIDAMLDHREAQAMTARIKGDTFKYLIYIGIFIVLVAVGLVILNTVSPTTVIDPGTISRAVEEGVRSATQTGTSLG